MTSATVEGLTPFDIALDMIPLSTYSSQLSPQIAAAISNGATARVYQSTFKTLTTFLNKLKSRFDEFPEKAISCSLARVLRDFRVQLAAVVDTGTRCSQPSYTDFLSSEPVSVTWKRFISFWAISVRVAQIFDPTDFLNFSLLYKSHLDDVPGLRAAKVSLPDDFLHRDGDLNLADYPFKKFVCETPFSFIYQSSDQALIEIFLPEPDLPTVFSRSVSSMKAASGHPNIVFFTAATDSLPRAICYELSDCSTLSSKLSKGDVSPTLLNLLLLDIARAIDFLHVLGVAHRFVNPNSIFVTSDNRAKLGGLYLSGSTFSDSIPITPSSYAAPELLSSPDSGNQSIDAYAFTILAWRLVTGECPHAGLSPSRIFASVVAKDERPPLPMKIPGVHDLFIRGWSRNPGARPLLAEFVRAIENGGFAVPGADTGEVKQRPSVEVPGRLSEAEIGRLVSLLISPETGSEAREEAEATLNAELDRELVFTVGALVRLLELRATRDWIIEAVYVNARKLRTKTEFARALFGAVEDDLALEIFLGAGIKGDEDARLLLQFGAQKSGEIPQQCAAAVITQLPNSLVLFDFVNANGDYFRMGLALLGSYDFERLSANRGLIARFLEKATGTATQMICNIVNRLDRRNADFDLKCDVFVRLVEKGFYDTVFAFAQNPAFARRFHEILLPRVALSSPVFAIKFLLFVLRVKSLADLPLPPNVLEIILKCVEAKECELAAQAAIRFTFSEELLKANAAVATGLCRVLLTSPHISHRSCVCLVLCPFVLQGDYALDEQSAAVVAQLLRVDDATEASRALCLAVAASKNSNVAKAMGDDVSLEAAARFFRSTAPPEYLYLAARFFVAIAPYLRLDNEAEPYIKESIKYAIASAMEHEGSPKVIEGIAQGIASLPKGEKWDVLLVDCQVDKFLEFCLKAGTGNIAIKTAVKVVQLRYRQ
jgi:serine/threonine protein kinase